MRNLLEEFDPNRGHGIRPPTILGVREHVFTGRCVSQTYVYLCSEFHVFHLKSLFVTICSVSSLASFMSNQETSFVTLGQRVLAKPLK